MATRTEHAGRVVHRIAGQVPNQRTDEWFAKLLHDAETSVPGWGDRAKSFVRGLWASEIIDAATMLSIEEDIDCDKNRPECDDLRTAEAIHNLVALADAALVDARQKLDLIEDPDVRQEAASLMFLSGPVMGV